MKTLAISIAVALAAASTCAVAQTTPGQLSGRLAWDFSVNKPLAVASYNDGLQLNIGPVSFGPATFGGTYLGSGGVGVGQGGQFSVNFQGKLFGMSLKGCSATLGYGLDVFTGQKPHPTLFFGGTVTSSLLSAIVK